MKFLTAVTMGAVMTAGAWARENGEVAKAVMVCINQGNLAAGPVFQSRATTSQIFAKIGLRIDWRRNQSACSASSGSISITLSEDTPADRRPGALAYAMPYQGSHVVVFYDRVAIATSMDNVPCLMGYVLAHEIAHVLQGIQRHSASGIMKGGWDDYDKKAMRLTVLEFMEEDIDLIHRGLNSRSSLAASQALDQTGHQAVR